MIEKIKSLVDEIELNIKLINEKSSQVEELKTREVMNIINVSRKYLIFEEIHNIKNFSSNVKYSTLNSFYSLCKHAIKVGEYKSGSKKLDCYMNEKDGVYELWLLWNNEFCVTRLYYQDSEGADELTPVREVVDYGRCPFIMYNNEFIWDIDEITSTIISNLEKNLTEKQNTRKILEDYLNKITDK